ncbi:putative ubiquinone biosynthesis [Phaeomoniella chlamydospora]|uniref:Putative ubiquinone biosynthesis n=1 Tax=Phaeomoniella chlamydospora TaxID=158046 RepID=A0A0G2GNA6_PHACM|nr:putative ubiquinone biosynthesis [Phaeomoniella chlamydospora]
MRHAFLFSRILPVRGGACNAVRIFPLRNQTRSRLRVVQQIWRSRGGSKATRTVLLSATLTPAAFLRISEQEPMEGKTSEEQMLEASRAELKKKSPKESHGLRRVLESLVFVFDQYFYEPLSGPMGCIKNRHLSRPDVQPFDDIFEEFQEKPLGVGAIAQVYKAKLKPDLAAPGPEALLERERTFRRKIRKNVDTLIKSTPERVPSSYVAIKVLHPHVERTVRRDLRIMGFFAKLINAIPTMHWLSLPDEVAQFGEMMRLQLDLRIECANLTKFRKNFQERTTAWFPYPYTDYTTRQVLVEEFAQGIPLEAFLQNGGGVFQQAIAGEGLDAFLHMLLIDNFVHADLHPGNIMVRFYHSASPDLPYSRRNQSKHSQSKDPNSPPNVEEIDETEKVLSRLRPHLESRNREAFLATLAQIDSEGYRPQLIFIDTGLVTELSSVNRKNFLDLFRAIAEFDGYRAGKLMIERCRQPEDVIDGEVFALRMQHLVLAVKGRTFALGNIKIGDVLGEVLSMVRSHHVRMEGDFVNVVISILLLEGIGRTLDPNLDLFKEALPILRKLGTSGGGAAGVLHAAKEGDFSFLKIWVGLEARRWLQASAETVEACVKYDQLSPNI